ncbi:MAG: DNA-processing protein DprA [Rubripirellula sp.]
MNETSTAGQRMESLDRSSGLPSSDPSISKMLMLAMLPGLGPRTLTSLLERFDDAEAVLSASGPELASVAGVGKKLVHTIRTASHHVDLESILAWCQGNDVEIVCRDEVGYPSMLEDLPDAPPLLYVRGEVLAEDEIAVAIVGTRHPTTYGLKQAERFAYALAKAGVTVVSGLARGIDAAAHEGALDGGGRTIAVLGSGLDQLYPSEHEGLASAVAADGAVISEYSPFAKPRGGMFPQRNRLIAGLSLATLVVEAPDRSGALITARLAGEQNREVLAVPGPVTSRASRGCNQLIRDGAKLVQTVDDILEELGPVRESVSMDSGREVRNGSELALNEIERQVLDAIEVTSTLVDEVIQRSKLPANRVIAVISVLEMRRLVRRLSGQYVSRI